MAAPKAIKKLIETFSSNIDFYKSPQYNEAQLRQEFLDPLFKELGWDMDNEAGLAPQYRDVIHEASIKIGGSTKAPDYAFTIHGQYKFFLEAKKPTINIKDDTVPAYQLRRYGWSAKLPISILSDFEEFAVYDCRKRPKNGERASTSRISYFQYTDYIEKWDELYNTFSKEAILKGAFDKYSVDAKRHRGTDTVDNAFLKEIENWRNLLARNIALRNPNISVRDLNFAVQKTIDRLIFLRISEDRGIEDYKRLHSLLKGGKIYPKLLKQFKQADARYNSGLFHFSNEKGRGAPDNITSKIKLDDKVLKEIISNLYYPDSPYEFSVLPADILGQVYEQFLGKTIRLTKGHQAKIEEKPEVRKAGGVYYTPDYIVDYIVENTLGRLLNGNNLKKPKPIAVSKAANIKVLDPACGSGSFLIVAYQYLLDWHLLQYIESLGKIKRHSAGKEPKLYKSPNGDWRLTTNERKRILTNNIFGVDIDAQAVEVTKLSLLLKVIEGEAHQLLQRDWIQQRQRILPDLENNIKCGNSLISSDFYDNEQMLLLDEEAQFRVNAFDWNVEFSEIMLKGGFDCILGNPPYVRIQLICHEEIDYLFDKYDVATSKIDLSVFFLERGLKLLGGDGRLSFITTKQWVSVGYGKNVRSLTSSGCLHVLVDFGSLPVFENADTYPAIVICSHKNKKALEYIKVPNKTFLSLEKLNTLKPRSIPVKTLGSEPWNFNKLDLRTSRFKKSLQTLSSFGHVYIGDLTGMDKAFVIPLDGDDKFNYSKYFLPYAYRGAEISRYGVVTPKSAVIYPYDSDQKGKPVLLPEENFKQKVPHLYNYLQPFKEQLKLRKDSRKFYAQVSWYRHLRPGSFNYIKPKKLIFKGVDKRLTVGLLEGNTIFNGANTPAFIPENLEGHDIKYLLGIMNSRLIGFHLSNVCPDKLGGYSRFSATCVNGTPIRKIEFDNIEDNAKHKKMVKLVKRMLELTSKKEEEGNPNTLRLLKTQIRSTDQQIDNLVYDLYGLSPEEIELVEESIS